MFTPKAILFDYGGTLDSDGLAWLDRIRPHYLQAGLAPLPAGFDRAFYEADDRLPSRHRLEGLDLAASVRLQVEDTLENLGLDKALAPAVTDSFVAESRAALASAAAVLAPLKARFKLGIVSNNYGNLASLLEKEGLAPLFDVVVDSAQVGAVKPDPKIFRAALEALGLEPSEALMVGDSLPRDMRGAEAMGMPHAWLAGERREAPCCASAAVLRRLSDLPALVKPSLAAV